MLTVSHNFPLNKGKTPNQIRQRICQIIAQRKTAIDTKKNFKSAKDPALAAYCLRLQLRLNELYWVLGEKPKFHA